ncbi:hypothetical protein C4587_00630 [Candidatus Parcubacteria bacterium]|nr:MAG: hypothetical protein C4587_00630 [Candidatus Parcubacteria bacterium]
MNIDRLKRIFVGLLYLTVVGTPVFYLRQAVYPYTLPKTAFFQFAVEVLFFVWAAMALLDKRYRPKKTPLVLAGAFFFGILALTAAAGMDPWRSFWSTQERALGVVTLLHVGALGLVISSSISEIPWRRLFFASVGTALLTSAAAMLQIENPHLLLEEPLGHRPGSTFGNPTFLAGYLAFHVFLAAYFLAKFREEAAENRLADRRSGFAVKLFLWTALALIAATLFITETRGDILGLGAGFLALLVLFAFSPPRFGSTVLARKKFYAVLVGGACLIGAAFFVTRASSFWSHVPGLRRFQDVSFSAETLQPRLIALRAGWRGFLDKPFLGWGWDNFNVVFNKYYDPKALEISYLETRFDKPHNAFLEYFVVGGVPLGVAYLAVIATFLYEAFRIRDKLLGRIATAAIAAYLVRSQFIFETIGPLLMLAVLGGVLDGMYRSEKLLPGKAEESRKKPSLLSSRVAYGSVILGIILAYAMNVPTLRATYNQFWGFKHFVNNRPGRAIASFKAAIAYRSPYRWNLKRDYAATVTEAYFYNPEIIPEEEARLAIRAMEEVSREHPHDAYNHYALVDMYNQASDLDPERFLAGAEREAEIALTLSPDRQEVYFSLAKTKSIKGDYESAIALVQKALELDPKVPDAHFYYGLLAFANGDSETGYRELREAMNLGRPWKNFYEPRVVGNYFADAGHLDEAIELYAITLEMRPQDVETKIKIGLAYFLTGEKTLARERLREVLTEVDLGDSPQYNELKPIFDELGLPI